MNLLIVGDIHIKPDNVEDINILLGEIERIVTLSEKGFTHIVLLGDILHTHEKILSQCLNRALSFIKKCSEMAYTYILVGNHDLSSQNLYLTDSHWMNVLKIYRNIKIIDKVFSPSIESPILFCPYVAPGKFKESLDTYEGDWMKKKIIFAHQEFFSCSMGGIISSEGDKWNISWPQVISGHIHDSQTIENVYYPGAPLQHSYGDTTKRILCSVHINEGVVSPIVEHTLFVPKKIIIRSDVGSFTVPSTTNCDIKIKISATAEEFKLFKQTKDYQEALKKNIKFQLIPVVNEPISAPNSINFMKILNDYIVSDGDPIVFKLFNDIVHGIKD